MSAHRRKYVSHVKYEPHDSCNECGVLVGFFQLLEVMSLHNCPFYTSGD